MLLFSSYFSDVDWWLVENKKSSSHGYVPSAYLAEKDSIDVFEWVSSSFGKLG